MKSNRDEKDSEWEGGEQVEIEVVGRLVKCSKCGRKILVERGLFGVNHTLEIIATCWDCLDSQARKRAIERYKLEVKNEGRRS